MKLEVFSKDQKKIEEFSGKKKDTHGVGNAR